MKIFLSFFLIILILLLISKLVDNNSDTVSHDEQTQSEFFYVKQLLYESIENDNISIEKERLISETIKDNRSGLDTTRPILIVRYSMFSCGSCVSFALEKIHTQLSNKIQKSNVLIVVSDYKPTLTFNTPNTINILSESLGLSIEETNTPFYFIFDKERVNHIFTPDADHPEYTDLYLKRMVLRYLNYEKR